MIRGFLRTCLPVVIASCAHASPSEPRVDLTGSQIQRAPEQTFDRQAWIDDYAALRGELERSYANLAWFALPAGGLDLPALHTTTVAALQSALNAGAAEAAIDSFVAAFHDGHFSKLPLAAPLPPASISALTAPDRSLSPTLGCGAIGRLSE